MENLIICGDKTETVKAAIDGLYHTTAHCSCCDRKIPMETWIKFDPNSVWVMSPPDNYVRVIFGIHPEIYSAQDESVPAVFTPTYFCKECEEKYHIVFSLLRIFLSFEPMIHPSASDSPFDPQRGCWITIWPLDKQSQPTWPIDYQVNLSIFREITEKLMNISNNPFRVYKR